MDYRVVINENKTISIDKLHINYKENEIDNFIFEIPSFLDEFEQKIAVFETPNRKKLEIPVIENKVPITNQITSRNGLWKLCFISTKGNIIFISDSIAFKVDKTYLDENYEEEINPNLDLVIQELKSKLKELEEIDFNEISEDLKKILEELSHLDLSKLDGINEKLEEINLNVLSIDITGIENKLDTIPKNDYTLVLSDIQKIISTINEIVVNIPTNDYTSDIESIKNTLTTIKSYVDDIGIIASNQISNHQAVMGTLGGVQQQMSTYYSQILNSIHTEVLASERNVKEKINEVKTILGDETKPDNTISNWSYWGLVRCEENKQISQQIYSLLTDADLLIEKI